jgi:hypothetical protein
MKQERKKFTPTAFILGFLHNLWRENSFEFITNVLKLKILALVDVVLTIRILFFVLRDRFIIYEFVNSWNLDWNFHMQHELWRKKGKYISIICWLNQSVNHFFLYFRTALNFYNKRFLLGCHPLPQPLLQLCCHHFLSLCYREVPDLRIRIIEVKPFASIVHLEITPLESVAVYDSHVLMLYSTVLHHTTQPSTLLHLASMKYMDIDNVHSNRKMDLILV